MNSSYDQDYYLWFVDQARLLRNGMWQHVDVEHLAEELEDMGKREKPVYRRPSFLPHAPSRLSNSWMNTSGLKHDSIEYGQ